MLFKHVLRNASVSGLIVMALQFVGLLGGAVFAEQIFALPGIGQILATSTAQNDIPMVMGVVLVTTVIVVVVNLADRPRGRHSSTQGHGPHEHRRLDHRHAERRTHRQAEPPRARRCGIRSGSSARACCCWSSCPPSSRPCSRPSAPMSRPWTRCSRPSPASTRSAATAPAGTCWPACCSGHGSVWRADCSPPSSPSSSASRSVSSPATTAGHSKPPPNGSPTS